MDVLSILILQKYDLLHRSSFVSYLLSAVVSRIKPDTKYTLSKFVFSASNGIHNQKFVRIVVRSGRETQMVEIFSNSKVSIASRRAWYSA